jgi:hypothetical protein
MILLIARWGGTKKWLDPHVKFCFSKFTNSAEDGKWCIVGADSNGSSTLVVPNATRGGPDPVKRRYEQAREEQAELFSTINLQCFQTNVKNTTSKWYKGAHNPANGSNPPRTMTDQHDTTTQDQEDNAVSGDIPQAADEDNVSFVCETIFLCDDKGNKMPFNYVQAKFTTSSTTSTGAYRSMENAISPFTLPLAGSFPTRTLQASAPLVVMIHSSLSSLSCLRQCSTGTYYKICLPTLEQTNPTKKWQRERCILLFQQS